MWLSVNKDLMSPVVISSTKFLCFAEFEMLPQLHLTLYSLMNLTL